MSEIHLSDANFQAEVLQSQPPVLVDFFAPWCGPCKTQGPIIAAVAKEVAGKAKVGTVDVDACPQTAGKYEIMSVPTLIIFQGGEIKYRASGLQSQEALISEINKLI